MRVLGISPLDKDATASIADDGQVLYAAGEERFSRSKQHAGFPYEAIACGLDLTGTRPEDIDEVSYPFLSWDRETARITDCLQADTELLHDLDSAEFRRLLKAADRYQPRRPGSVHGLDHPEQLVEKSALKQLAYQLLALNTTASRTASQYLLRKWANAARAAHQHWQQDLETGLATLGLAGKLKRYDHHTSHAANAYLTSGFERALIVTIDGYGTGLAGSISLGEGGKRTRLARLPYPHSLGTFYEMVTSALRFNPSRHAGKIVGLAAYGDPDRLSEALLACFDRRPGEFFLKQADNVFLARHLASRYPMIDVAAAYQNVLEVIVQEWIAHWLKETGTEHVVLSGGVTANVKMNQRIFEIPGVRQIYVYPNMGDGGCGTGLALLRTTPSGEVGSLDSVYLGPEYSDAAIRAELEAAGLDYRQPDNLAREVAQLINDGKVVARFSGRMEYGPRALGNRSIMYHAKEPEINQWLNQRLGRTEFMPFAPVTLYEERDRCYHNLHGAEHAAEFMTVTFDCTPFMKQHCPAAVHVDGTARPQLIRREINEGYYDILAEFHKLTGVPSLINTSFNMHEEPIVCSPGDAIRGYTLGSLDALAIGSFLVTARHQ